MAVEIIGLLHAAKDIHELYKLIEGGDVAASLGDIEMSAARDAFSAVPYSVDKRGQVWTCIGHLTTAQHAYEHFLRSKRPRNVSWTRHKQHRDANVKRRFVLVLKVVCYKYLNEH